jgi:DNA-binding GntR family transcriptional regulator
MNEVAAKSTLASSVHSRLRADLLRGLLPPGGKLRVEWLAATYDAGASPVREALNRLAAEGLLDRHDQRGFFVRAVSRAELEELTRTRCWLEERALRETIAHRSTQWEEQLVLALHRLSRMPRHIADATDTNPEWERLHRDFHRALIAGCRSRWLIGFCNQLADQAYHYRQIARASAAQPRNEPLEHTRIVELAIANDADAAVAALSEHYQRTSDLCRAGLPE